MRSSSSSTYRVDRVQLVAALTIVVSAVTVLWAVFSLRVAWPVTVPAFGVHFWAWIVWSWRASIHAATQGGEDL